MGVAPLVAEVLKRQHVRGHLLRRRRAHADRRRQPGQPLGAWWKARAAEGHEFASHTYDHVYWRGDVPGRRAALSRAPVGRRLRRPRVHLDRGAVLRRHRQVRRDRLQAHHRQEAAAAVPRAGRQDLAEAAGGRQGLRLRARGLGAGRLPRRRAAERDVQQRRSCCSKALRDIRPATSCWRTWASGRARTPGRRPILEPLIVGLKAKGFCFATLREHPAYRAWIAAHPDGAGRMQWTGSPTFSPTLQQWLFETAVQPLVYALGLGGCVEDAFDATGWLLVGLIQIAVLLAVIGPLQRWRPVEPVTDRRADPHRHPLHADPPARAVPPGAVLRARAAVRRRCSARCACAGWGTLHLDELWPGVTDVPWVSFAIYLVVLDFVDYWIHRGQHRFDWWWGLHSLHHSQRQMTMWSDNRNHLLDDLMRDAIIVVVAQLIGVAPGQFIAIVAITQLSESLQHANLRLRFGAHRRAAVDQPALPPPAPQHRHRPRDRTGRRHAGRPQLRRAAALVGHAVPHRQLRACATTPPASATRSSPMRRAACATTGAASGRSNGWACRRLVGRG